MKKLFKYIVKVYTSFGWAWLPEIIVGAVSRFGAAKLRSCDRTPTSQSREASANWCRIDQSTYRTIINGWCGRGWRACQGHKACYVTTAGSDHHLKSLLSPDRRTRTCKKQRLPSLSPLKRSTKCRRAGVRTIRVRWCWCEIGPSLLRQRGWRAGLGTGHADSQN